ncbi:MBL fold metallo-hydrolase [Flavobacterium sp. Fl-77]|uniref:MBL fold metallo-hydrolase n=1 Tax=Flavobacterium flavipigmentatum TaxID=2893884 RepID=A0AAJ2SF98_9FLAO|nr:MULTISPECIES: MBL fold metallo-hydrolase [unclassified Flavobacterium]MDX6183159.1 MBL fold metallo-hydrolase [Flavobacterium sp. Fl-33]MDX6186772.1 MBL fold metallo-hydrolase [Flavobacterium sp. Fl-77]UFH40426.1 MBL fold metallo-hydrolase [Flavobacterium sp. F-70]
MGTQKIYLKNNVQVEPLISNWYAWHHIIPPILTGFNVVNRYIPIMESYINDPSIHEAAVKDPAFRGGPFIDLDKKHVAEVEALLINTKKLADPLFEFVDAVKELDKLLKKKASGYLMQPLYKEVPSAIRGYVELYYDRHHRPDFRFYEPLIYASPYYIESFQSVKLSLINKDADRPFIFSTPRLSNLEAALELKLPFKSNKIDELFKMKREPQTFEYIANLLNIDKNDEVLFKDLFTTSAPKKYEKYTGDSMRIRYFGHACILIETKEHSIVLDPVLSYTYESDVSRYTYDDLPDEIDYVLITHGHHDHILMETMLQIRHKVKNIIVGKSIGGAIQDPSLNLLLRNLGFENIIELEELQTVTAIDGIKITGIPFIGEHHDIHINSKLSYHVELDGYSLLAVADSCNQSPELYEHVHEIIGDVDVLFMGMECDGAPASWVYGPIFTTKQEREKDFSRRGRGSNYDEGIKMVNCFNVKEVYVYAMGEEPWVRHILDVEYTDESNPIVQSNMLMKDCRNRGIVAERLFAEKELFKQNVLTY